MRTLSQWLRDRETHPRYFPDATPRDRTSIVRARRGPCYLVGVGRERWRHRQVRRIRDRVRLPSGSGAVVGTARTSARIAAHDRARVAHWSGPGDPRLQRDRSNRRTWTVYRLPSHRDGSLRCRHLATTFSRDRRAERRTVVGPPPLVGSNSDDTGNPVPRVRILSAGTTPLIVAAGAVLSRFQRLHRVDG